MDQEDGVAIGHPLNHYSLNRIDITYSINKHYTPIMLWYC
jgi:hypothetical protein